MTADLELAACTPESVDWDCINDKAVLPYGCSCDIVLKAMQDFITFLGFVNNQLHSRGMRRLEALLMPANFSSVVSEFVAQSIPRYGRTLVRNKYPNGHPDLLPARRFAGDAAQHARVGIEVKASRKKSGWQGHNVERGWLMVFVFRCNAANDRTDTSPSPFAFSSVFAAELSEQDWKFSGRSATSHRTITASVTKSGYKKMAANWIYSQSPQALALPL